TDNMWRGPVSLMTNTTIKVPQNSRLTIAGVIDDPSAASSLTIAGGGKLVLAGNNTYRGGIIIAVGSIVNIQSSTALGSGTVVVPSGASLEIQGNLTISNPLQVQGTGVTSVPAGAVS